MENKRFAADIDSIKKARELIEPYVNKTAVVSSTVLNKLSGKKLLQKGGAFKFRGAANAMFSLDEEQALKGVVTHRSGNHAAALYLAAQLQGIPAYVVVPNTAPKCKVDNVKCYGGEVIFSECSMKARQETATKLVLETGAVLVPPSNDPRIISGQGTVPLEFLDQVPQLDTLIGPISGGGLISGVAIGAKSINPAIRVLAAEPKGADDAAQSKASSRIITLSNPNTIADGLLASLGDHTWPIVRDLIDDIITVDDKDIIQAVRYCFEILKIVVEPSGAIGLAVVLSEGFMNNPIWENSPNIGIVLFGGNLDLCRFVRSVNNISHVISLDA